MVSIPFKIFCKIYYKSLTLDDNNEKLNELINNILEDNADYKYLEKTYLYVMIKRLQNSLNEILKKKNTFFPKNLLILIMNVIAKA